MKNPKIIILGYARSGKDTMAEILLKNFPKIKFHSATQLANEIIIYPILKEKYGYISLDECYADRVNHRKEWYDMIYDFNLIDKARLSKILVKYSDIYVGIRHINEFEASKHLFDLIIWVDSSKRCEPESLESCTVCKEMADIIIENNGTLQEFESKIIKLGNLIFKK